MCVYISLVVILEKVASQDPKKRSISFLENRNTKFILSKEKEKI